jgi:hypothetical protein
MQTHAKKHKFAFVLSRFVSLSFSVSLYIYPHFLLYLPLFVCVCVLGCVCTYNIYMHNYIFVIQIVQHTMHAHKHTAGDTLR